MRKDGTRKRDLVAEREQMRRWRAANPPSDEKIAKQRAARRERYLREREATLAVLREWRKNNPAEAAALDKANYAKNKERARAKAKAWREKNRDRDRATQK